MAERKPQWPELGDLTIAATEMITEYGSYAKLDEYDKLGVLPVSEIYSRENQKVVLNALNVLTNVSKASEQGIIRRDK